MRFLALDLKLGKELRNPAITAAVITNAGIAGIVIPGAVEGASLNGATITEVGMISTGGRVLVPWPKRAHPAFAPTVEERNLDQQQAPRPRG